MKLGIKELINRYRHNRGFGIQSPNAFHFVTAVLREKHAFYAYSMIERAVEDFGGSSSHCRLLFRITNYVQPSNIVMLSPCVAYAYSIMKACSNTPAYLFDVFRETSLLKTLNNCQYCNSELATLFKELGSFGLFYIGNADLYRKTVEETIKYASSSSVIIVENVHFSRETEIWWQNIKQNPLVCVTFDLYSMGILFFDKKYNKQHYSLKM